MFAGPHILLEGPSDSRFWKMYYRQDVAQIVICGGKSNVIASVLRLDVQPVPQVLGIVDDDLDYFLGRTLPSRNLISYFEHDLECMVLSTGALEDTLQHLGDDAAIANYEGSQTTIRDAVITRSIVFAKLRLISAVQHHHVDFNKFSPWKYISRTTWTLNVRDLINDYARESGQSPTDIETLYKAAPEGPVWRLLQGHDTIDIVAISLSGIFHDAGATPGQVFSHMSLAFHSGKYLRSTTLFAQLSAWEAAQQISIVRNC
ncbi:MAG TPA: DUF4435 domain-containing protein [Candidatus Elarobacter sp.]|nr:DUF4435 domain-containing protein [Candidatus Elarobacter sp.]